MSRQTDQFVAHCVRFTFINSHLCDYGRQCALIAALAMQERGECSVQTQMFVNGYSLPAKISTDGSCSVVDGLPGQKFKLFVQGHHQVLDVEFYVNWQSVHEVLRRQASFAISRDEYFLSPEVLADIEADVLGALTMERLEFPEMDDIMSLFASLRREMMREHFEMDPLGFFNEYGSEGLLELLPE